MDGFQTKICSKCNVEQHLYFFPLTLSRDKYYNSSRCQSCMVDEDRNRKRVDRPQDNESTKFCVGCGETKSLSEYSFFTKGGVYSKTCKICRNKETAKGALKRKYGVDWVWKEETLKAQNDKCAICRVPFNGTNLKPHIDHDASSGKARAILCPACNIMLGIHNESVETLRAAGFDRHAEYIERYKKIHEIKLVG